MFVKDNNSRISCIMTIKCTQFALGRLKIWLILYSLWHMFFVTIFWLHVPEAIEFLSERLIEIKQNLFVPFILAHAIWR